MVVRVKGRGANVAFFRSLFAFITESIRQSRVITGLGEVCIGGV